MRLLIACVPLNSMLSFYCASKHPLSNLGQLDLLVIVSTEHSDRTIALSIVITHELLSLFINQENMEE